ncbi:hypothetical protein BH23VER1_BH23VER1_16690 [soil metagenome]
MKLLLIFFILAVAVIVPYLIWGAGMEETFSGEAAIGWLRDHGRWAWAVGIGLIISDLFLPVPATAVISALGYLYGPLVGGAFGATGSFLSGALAYQICLRIGRKAAVKIAGEKDLAKGERLFAEAGGWVVALSRWTPILPEVVACMAGLTRMPAARFYTALACGSVPLGFAFAAVGAAGVESPVLALSLSAAIPAVLWLAASRVLRPQPGREKTPR